MTSRTSEQAEVKPGVTFDNAVALFRAGQYEKSYEAISMYLEQQPQTGRIVESLYLKGRNERFLKKYSECIATFHNVIQFTKVKKDSYYNYALYQSGICYEMIGQVDKAVAVYQDALRFPKSLPSQLRDLEIPSRLALCYARLNETKASEKYYNQLQKALKEYLSNSEFKASEKEFYAEILFSMSSLEIPLQDQQDFESVVRSLEINQATLIELLKFNLEPYTQKALSAYIVNYENLYAFLTHIKMLEGLDPILASRNKQIVQKKMALQVLQNIEDLEVMLTPEMSQSNLKPQFDTLKDLKNRFDAMAVQRMSGDGLTPNAEDKEGLKREGRVIDKKTILEEKGAPKAPPETSEKK